ncbi:MAG: DNA polymerase III subunit delta [Eubacteriales bacterium]|nr:DNA polymerase III subunit delta [Eubacteriales bacterium]
MARLKEEEFKQQIKSGNFAGAYLIYGEETYLKELYVKKIKEKIIDPTFEDFNFHEYENRNASILDILQDADMMPMMSQRSMVLVHDFPFDTESDVKHLLEYLEDVSDTCVLVFKYDSIQVDTKNQKKWAKIEKAFAKAGHSVNLEKKSESELARTIVAYAKKRDCIIDTATARYLISVVGSDIKTIFNELEKLCSFSKTGTVTGQDIDSVAVKSLQARVYDLSKFITRGDSDNAYAVLNTLFEMKESPLLILSVISSCFVDMYRAKCANAANVKPNDLNRYFNYKGREFVITNAVRDCRNVSVDNLRRSLDVLADTDEKMKSTAISEKLLLEETIAKLLALRTM